jgi:hypothetical protein
LRAVFAIANDTLTLLCRRRLFWLNIWLSVAVVLVVASMNCGKDGWSIGFGLRSWSSGYLIAGSIWEKTLFFGVVRRAALWWVAGAAPLLALFSLASVVPKTLKSGQAALLFTKTRGRSEVLLGRFAGGLIFAAIPALICVTGLFLTLGWRTGVWEPRLFFSIPFALLLFAVVAAVTVMLGVLTKSSSASLVVALIFASSVIALQDAAARPSAVDEEGELNGLMRASGGSIALQAIAWPLPRTQQLSEGMDRAIGLKSPRLFRELIRLWRVGNVRVGDTAVDVLDATQEMPPEEVTPLKLGEAIMVTSGFCGMTLVAAALMLNRRDL